MKKILLLACLVLLALPVMAQETHYCDEYPAEQDCVCRKVAGYDNAGLPLYQELEDITAGSDWMSLYCTGTTTGEIRQRRTAFQIIKPACTERIEITEYQNKLEEYCKKCPVPKLISGYEASQCAGTKTVFERTVIAYYYLPTVDECELGRFTEYTLETQGICATPGGNIVLALTKNWVVVAAGMLIAGIAIGYFLIKRKRR